MQPQTIDKIMKWLVYIDILVILIVGYLIYEQYTDPGCVTCQMYNPEVKNGLNGVYNPNQEYYCVWTRGRMEWEIEGTETHERCHALVHKEEKHFCDWRDR